MAEPITNDGRQAQSAENDDEAKTSGASASAPAAKAEAEDCTPGSRRACVDANGRDLGTIQDCDADRAWGACHVDQSQSSSTPLVLVFDGAPVTFAPTLGPTIDLAGDGASHVMSSPTARTPWLALDRDGNGRIDDGSELFGSMTRLSTGVRAKNGFEALAELDSNHDGAITAEDDGFAKLLVWSDAERLPASERIVRIELAYRVDRRCTTEGDCEVERAKLVYRGTDGAEHAGEVVDVHLRHR